MNKKAAYSLCITFVTIYEEQKTRTVTGDFVGIYIKLKSLL